MSPPKPSRPFKSPHSPTPSTTPNHNQPPPIIVTESPGKKDVEDDTTLPVPLQSEKDVNNKRDNVKFNLTAVICAAGICALLSAIAIWLYPQLLNPNNGKLDGSDTTIPQQEPVVIGSVTVQPNKGKTTTDTKCKRCRKGDILRPTESDFDNPTPKTNKERRDELRQVVSPFHGPAKVEEDTLLQQYLGGICVDEETDEHEYCGLVKVWEEMSQGVFKVTAPFNTNRELIIWDDLFMKSMGTKKCIYFCELPRSDVPEFMKVGRCTNAGQCYCLRYAITDDKDCLVGMSVDEDPNCYCILSLDDTVEEDRRPTVDLLRRAYGAYEIDFEKEYKKLELSKALTAEERTGFSAYFMFTNYLFLGPGSDSYFEEGELVESLAVGVFMNAHESMMQQVLQVHEFEIKGVMHENLQSPILQFVGEKLIPELNGAIKRRLKNMNLIHVEFPNRVPPEWPVPDHLRQVNVYSYTYLSSWEPSYAKSPPEGLEEDQDKYGYVHNEDDEEDEQTTTSTIPAGFVRDGTQIALTPLFYNMMHQIWDSKDTINPAYEPEYQIEYWIDLLEYKGAPIHDPSLVYDEDDIKNALFYLDMFLIKFEKTRGSPFFDAWETRIDRNGFVFKHVSYDVVTLLEKRGYIVYDRFEGSVELWKENEDCQIFYVEVHPAPWPAFGSYPNGGPGSRVPFSMTEHARHLSNALEIALAVAMAIGFREGGLDPENPFTASTKMFGNVIMAWGFRTYCIRNAHFSTRACTLISKVMMAVHLLDGMNLHPLAISGLKNMFVSQKERDEAGRGGLGGKSGLVRERDLGDKFRAIFSTPGLFGSDWGQGDNECTKEVDEFAKFLVSQTTWNSRRHFEDWMDATMSKKVVSCVVEAIRKAYTEANPNMQTKREKEDEEKRKAREERRRSASA